MSVQPILNNEDSNLSTTIQNRLRCISCYMQDLVKSVNELVSVGLLLEEIY
jgi:cytochrome c-type biogenesis protein CcmH/NrfF